MTRERMVRGVMVVAGLVGASVALAALAQNSSSPRAKAEAHTIRTVARGIAAASGAPFSLAVGATGKIYIAVGNAAQGESADAVADSMTNRVFELAPDGAMNVFAGNGRAGSMGDGGTATEAELNLAPDGFLSVGCAQEFFRDAPGNVPGCRTWIHSGIAIDAEGNIFIADTLNQTIRRVSRASSTEPGVIRSVAGRFGGPTKFNFFGLAGLAADRAGNLYLADAPGNAIYILREGELELLAEVEAPGALAVDASGARVYVASPALGRVFEIDAAGPRGGAATAGIREVTDAATQQPSGLAVDAAGNLFIADAQSNVIRRIDARTGAVTVVAGTGAAGDAGDGGPAPRAELNAPGALGFDEAGNLFVADEGNRAIREIAALGTEQASGSVTLSPASINYGDQLTGGTTAAQTFTLTNGTNAMLTGISVSFVGADPGDFSSTNSCGSSVAAMKSCSINVTFAPTANGARSAILSVADSDSSSPQTASVSGTGDDFSLVPQNASSPTTLNVLAGATATFNLAVHPDNVFSGTVEFVCPTNLPAQATCTFSPTSLKVTPGKSQNFSAAFATVVHQVVPGGDEREFPAPPRGWPIAFIAAGAMMIFAACRKLLWVLGAHASIEPAHRDIGRPEGRPYNVLATGNAYGCCRGGLYARPLWRVCHPWCARRRLMLAMALGAVVAFAGGCYKKKYKPVTGSQAGTYSLTVNATAQSASRGITLTLNVQ